MNMSHKLALFQANQSRTCHFVSEMEVEEEEKTRRVVISGAANRVLFSHHSLQAAGRKTWQKQNIDANVFKAIPYPLFLTLYIKQV